MRFYLSYYSKIILKSCFWCESDTKFNRRSTTCFGPGRVAQSVTCLATGVSDCRSRGCEFDPCPYHTFVEIDHEIISTVVLLPSTESFKKGCCQLEAKVCVQSTG